MPDSYDPFTASVNHKKLPSSPRRVVVLAGSLLLFCILLPDASPIPLVHRYLSHFYEKRAERTFTRKWTSSRDEVSLPAAWYRSTKDRSCALAHRSRMYRDRWCVWCGINEPRRRADAETRGLSRGGPAPRRRSDLRRDSSAVQCTR